MAKPTFKAYQKQLLEMRDQIQHLSETTQDERKPVKLDQSSVGRLSRMDALQVQAMQLETERRRSIELQRIEAALARINSGDFGYCLVCDEEIEAKRLKHDPSLPNCIACAQGMDR